MLAAPGRHPPFELGLPAIQRPPSGSRIGRSIGPIDELVRTSHEPVQRVHRRADLSGEAQGGAVERGIVPALHSSTGPVRRTQIGVSARIHPCILANESKPLSRAAEDFATPTNLCARSGVITSGGKKLRGVR